MSKELEALNNLLHFVALNYKKMSVADREYNDMKAEENLKIVVKGLKALEIIEEKGIAFLVPESDYSNEHIHIDIYTNTLSEEELKTAKEVMRC